MLNTLLIWLAGWPGILLALAASATGILRRSPVICLAGAVLVIPFAYYLSGSPIFRWLGLLLPFFQLATAWAVREKRLTWAWLTLAPLVGITVWLAGAVLGQ